jgi:hypothetical protein
MRIASAALPLAAIRLSELHHAELRISGAKSDIEILLVLGLVEQSIVTTTSAMHTHHVAVLELDNPVHQILLGSLGTPRVVKLRVGVLGRHMMPTVDAEFHKIT